MSKGQWAFRPAALTRAIKDVELRQALKSDHDQATLIPAQGQARRRGKGRAPLPFKQGDVTRAIKAAQAAGLAVYRIEIVDRKPVIMVGGAVDNPKDDGIRSWDEAIAELESRQ